jgi:hypothetical protein
MTAVSCLASAGCNEMVAQRIAAIVRGSLKKKSHFLENK